MSDISVRSDSVDVEQIMRQIRARIREKRGADYTEAELQQLATVKLEKFLDPRGLRSDLVEQFRRKRVVSPAPPNYTFGEETLFETHRGFLRSIRQIFKPLLKLFFNPDKITSALHIQAQVNTQAEERLRRLEEREPLSYELLHNLTLEITRLGIEVHNMKMRVESLSSRVDFDERRSRSLESVVQYRSPQQQRQPPPAAPAPSAAGPDGSVQAQAAVAASVGENGTAENGERKRRRRRRRRRPGGTAADGQGGAFNADAAGGNAGAEADDSSPDDGGDADSSDPSDATGQ